MRNFRNFQVYQKALELSFKVYDVASELPENEKYGLRSQITRCGVSVPSNIAEGSGRETTKVPIAIGITRFLDIALGSLYELETQLEIIRNKINSNLVPEVIMDQVYILQKQLTTFIKTVKRNG